MRQRPIPTAAMRLIDERDIGPWWSQGLCSQTDPEAFFPEGGTSHTAIAICKQCPVREQCLAHALEHYEHGVWGGMTERERGKLRASRRRVA